ncbi:MAG: DUF1015 domain-containing protein [Christensenellales bacterium]
MTVVIPEILLPRCGVDYSKWAVIACDQFTSQPEYWQRLDEYVGDACSTLRLIYPEVYLDRQDKKERTAAINATMSKYVDNDVFETVEDFILVERQIADGRRRLGLMIAVDLEDYDYTPHNEALIKATEKTVVERLPARIEVRRGASIEVPHIMLLMDDENDEIIGGLYANREKLQKLYDFELNMGGGRLCGYRVNDSKAIMEKLEKFADKQQAKLRYGVESGLMFVVGDGNHSLATAKECWREIKKSLTAEQAARHPARYALCELVNLHDKSLEFSPIHRVVFNAGLDFINYLQERLQGENSIKAVYRGQEFVLKVNSSPSDAIADVQQAIDDYLVEHRDVAIDYVHGDEYTLQVARQNDAVAIFMPTISKQSLFGYVARRGVLPRKSFSMGHAEDKRYYMEARKIK